MRKKDEQEEQQVCSHKILRLPLQPVIVQRRHTGRNPQHAWLSHGDYKGRVVLFQTYPQHVSKPKQSDALLQSSFCAQASVPSPVRLSMLLTGCLVQARLVCGRDRAWNEIRIPADMGMDCGHYKWYQNQSIVELAFPVPENVQPKEA